MELLVSDEPSAELDAVGWLSDLPDGLRAVRSALPGGFERYARTVAAYRRGRVLPPGMDGRVHTGHEVADGHRRELPNVSFGRGKNSSSVVVSPLPVVGSSCTTERSRPPGVGGCSSRVTGGRRSARGCCTPTSTAHQPTSLATVGSSSAFWTMTC